MYNRNCKLQTGCQYKILMCRKHVYPEFCRLLLVNIRQFKETIETFTYPRLIDSNGYGNYFF